MSPRRLGRAAAPNRAIEPLHYRRFGVLSSFSIVGAWCTAFDKKYLDGTLHGLVSLAIGVSKWDRVFDEKVVDGMVNLVGSATTKVGHSFRVLQTGKLRQYVMFIAVGVLALFLLLFAVFPK